MNIAPEHLARIEACGYSRTQAQFLYLVATHSGYFTLRQFLRFAQVKRGGSESRFSEKLLRLRHARTARYGSQTFVYNLYSRLIYEPLEKDNLCNRRQLSSDLIRTRLMILDFVLDHLEPHYFETEAHKVGFFQGELCLPLTVLPGRTYKGINANFPRQHYFADRFPIFIPGGDACLPTPLVPTFVYCDSGGPGLLRYIHHLCNYESLLHRLTAFNFVYAAPTDSKFKRAAKLFASRFDYNRVDTEGLVRYFEVRRLWESHNTGSLTRADRQLLREGDKRFQGGTFEQMYLEWAAGRLSGTGVNDAFAKQKAQASKVFSTCILPNAYDIFERISAEHSVVVSRPVARNRDLTTPSTTPTADVRRDGQQEANTV